jgi:hypothetical protein
MVNANDSYFQIKEMGVSLPTCYPKNVPSIGWIGMPAFEWLWACVVLKCVARECVCLYYYLLSVGGGCWRCRWKEEVRVMGRVDTDRDMDFYCANAEMRNPVNVTVEREKKAPLMVSGVETEAASKGSMELCFTILECGQSSCE